MTRAQHEPWSGDCLVSVSMTRALSLDGPVVEHYHDSGYSGRCFVDSLPSEYDRKSSTSLALLLRLRVEDETDRRRVLSVLSGRLWIVMKDLSERLGRRVEAAYWPEYPVFYPAQIPFNIGLASPRKTIHVVPAGEWARAFAAVAFGPGAVESVLAMNSLRER